MSETVDVTVPIGVSGVFLQDKQKFSQLASFFAELWSSKRQLQKVELQLLCCNDLTWLSSFENRCRRLKRDPDRGLVSLVAKLETEKDAFQATVTKVRCKILKLEPTALDTVTTMAGAYLPLTVAPAKRRMPKPDIIARNAVIDSMLNHSDFAICQLLDVEFPSNNERPAAGLPDSWEVDYSVLTYCEAYQQCPQLVHTLISKRRSRSRLPHALTDTRFA